VKLESIMAKERDILFKSKAELYNRYIAFGVDLARMSEGTSRKVLKLFNEIEVDIGQQVGTMDYRDIDLAGDVSIRQLRGVHEARRKHLQMTLDAMKGTVDGQFNRMGKSLISDLNEVGALTYDFMKSQFAALIGVELSSRVYTKDFIEELVKGTLVQGRVQREWWLVQKRQFRLDFENQLAIGMLQGENNQQLVERVLGVKNGRRALYRDRGTGEMRRYAQRVGGVVMDKAKRKAGALVRTSVMSVNNAMMDSFHRSNENVIKALEAQAVLDGRTTPICISRSKLRWKLDGTPLGHSQRFPGYPPWHWQCRTVLLPITKTWTELSGKTRRDLVRKAERIGLDGEKVQASMNGPVARSLNYEQWLSRQPPGVAREVLGVARYDMWKDGKLSLRNLIDQRGRPLSVDQLRARWG